MTVYAWGYGDVLENILRGIAWLFDPSGGLMVMLGKITILIGFIAVLLSYFGDYGQRDPLRILKFYVLAIGVWTLFMQVKTTVQIDDIQDNQSRVVQNVPYAIAYPLAFTSQVQKAVAQTLDQVFGLPDDCGYSKTGMLGCVGVVNSALSMRITDPYLYQSFNQFITNCVYTNILDGTYNLEDLQTSQNLLTYMGSSLHPARFTKVYADAECQWTDSGCSPCKAGCSMDCPSAYNYLINQLYNYANYQALNALAYATGMTTSAVSQALNTAPPYLLNVSQTGQSLLLQSIAMNHLGEAYLRWAEANLAPGVGYAVGVAQRQVEAQGISSYFVAGKYLPVLRGILIVLLAGFTSALFILLLTPMAVRALTGYMILFLWTILWSVGDALLNAIIHVKLHGATSFSSLGQGGLTLMTLPVVQQSAMDYISMAGQFYWMIPTLALLASTGFSIHAMNSLSGAVSSPAQSGTASASSQVAQGNLGGGNVSWNNQSFGNTDWGGWRWGNMAAGNTQEFNTGFGNINTMARSYVDKYGILWSGAGNNVAGYVYGKTLGEVAQSLKAGNYLKDSKSRRMLDDMLQAYGEDAVVSMMEIRGGKLVGGAIVLSNGGKVEFNPNMPDTGKTSIGGSEFVFKLGDNGEYIFEKASHQGINSSILQSYRKQLAEKLSVVNTLSEMAKFAEAYGMQWVVAKLFDKYKNQGYRTSSEFFGILEEFKRIAEAQKQAVSKGSGFTKGDKLTIKEGTQHKDEVGGEVGGTLGAGVNFGVIKVGGEGKVYRKTNFATTEETSHEKSSSMEEYFKRMAEKLKSEEEGFTGSGGSRASRGDYTDSGTARHDSRRQDETASVQQAIEELQALQKSLTKEFTEAQSLDVQAGIDIMTRYANQIYQIYRDAGYDPATAKAITEQAIRDMQEHMLKTGDLSSLIAIGREYSEDLKKPQELQEAQNQLQTVPQNIQEKKEEVKGNQGNVLQKVGPAVNPSPEKPKRSGGRRKE